MGYDFRAAYVPGVAQTGAGQTVGLLELDGYYANDIAAYEAQAGLPAVPLVNIPVDGFDMQPSTNSEHVLEVSMDIEMVISMAPGLSNVLVYEATSDGASDNDLLERIASDNLAQQISSSWEFHLDTNTIPILQKMCSQGQSFFQAFGVPSTCAALEASKLRSNPPPTARPGVRKETPKSVSASRQPSYGVPRPGNTEASANATPKFTSFASATTAKRMNAIPWNCPAGAFTSCAQPPWTRSTTARTPLA
jgi:hypothetical protein